jgi:hypothetical protein
MQLSLPFNCEHDWVYVPVGRKSYRVRAVKAGEHPQSQFRTTLVEYWAGSKYGWRLVKSWTSRDRIPMLVSLGVKAILPEDRQIKTNGLMPEMAIYWRRT